MALDIKSKIRGLEIALKKVVRDVNKKSQMQDYGDFTAEMIRKRTRLGYGVTENGAPRTPLAKLAVDTTVRQRRRLKDRGQLSPLTSPGKSNLTSTASMLDGIKAERADTGKVQVNVTGRHPSGKANSTIAKYAADGSNNRPKREFMNLSDREIKQVQDYIRRAIVAIVKKL